MKESKGESDEGPPCSKKLGRLLIGNKQETLPAESALRIAPVCKNHLPHELEDLVTSARTRGGEPGFGVL